MASSSSEQQQQQSSQNNDDPSYIEKPSQNDVVIIHKTKTIQFFGRSCPIVLQNDNGPCPLLAILSQEKLLSLVAERLIDSNSNVNNKDAEYVKNQQQNIADAIDLLPRLTTGIDVNTKFCRINDFEFTPECAIFDLLDIPLYHGWLVDPQDHDTSQAIGSKSYNTIMSDLVALEARKMESEGKDKVDEDCIDFAAATTATLGVPSPNLSRAKSLDDSPRSTADQQSPRKGDIEEEEVLLRVLRMSENEIPTNVASTSAENVSLLSDENLNVIKSTSANDVNVSKEHDHDETSNLYPSGNSVNSASLEDHDATLIMKDNQERQNDQLISAQPFEDSSSNDLPTCPFDVQISQEDAPSLPPVEAKVPCQNIENLSSSVQGFAEELHKQNGEEKGAPVEGPAGSESSSGRTQSTEAVESFTPSLAGSEPMYEGEECILDASKSIYENREPVYEGEVVLAEQADKGTGDAFDGSSKDSMTLRQGEHISNFLKSNASQLTFYGLFSLQEGLKERELCVFFRNNHFSTMFKLEGELYLLATDQGYMNQPDLVWEKLNEVRMRMVSDVLSNLALMKAKVNGDTLFMTCNFTEFRLESSSNNGTWDQQNAVSTTADYLASIDSSSPDGVNMNSDLQLAIALQQQEFEQQQQPPQRNPPQQPSAVGSNRLVTGPQLQEENERCGESELKYSVPRTSGKATSSTSKQDQKSKDKSSNCKIM
ncbi:hypothetical protein KSS87_015240 [Heliosperma pusillum]|nr:hypothetical protein KSS87_015240 [Heliosperma pusillum]